MTAPPAGALEACLALLEKATFSKIQWGWRNDDDAPGSIFHEPTDGHAYAVAMCPRYGKDDWQRNADALVTAVNLLKDHGPALLAALRLREWRPEESAPKDGTKFLALTHFGDIEINQWCSMGNFRWEHVEGNTYRKVEEAPSEFWNGNSFTHWMPLPAPPTADDLAQQEPRHDALANGEAASA